MFFGGEIDAGSISLLGLGFALGLKHALDADHLIAVSTIVSERKGVLSSAIVGGLWGIGHTASLLLVGLILIALRIDIPEKVALGLEFGVAAMLVGLGCNVIWKLLRGGAAHTHMHRHGDYQHIHPHVHAHEHNKTSENPHSHHKVRLNRLAEIMTSHVAKSKRSIVIGMVHGLAGSGALMLIVLATIPNPMLGLLCITVFGVGSIGGMLVMSTVLGIPFVITAQRSEKINLVVRGISGMLSVGFGIFLGWQIGYVEGLFR